MRDFRPRMPEWFRGYADLVQVMSESEFSRLMERSLMTTVSRDTSVQWRGDYASVPKDMGEAMALYGVDSTPWKVKKFVVSDVGKTRRVQLEVFPDKDFDFWAVILKEIKDAAQIQLTPLRPNIGNEAPQVVTITDLHYGAKVKAVGNTQTYSVEILADYLSQIARNVNEQGRPVLFALLGDMIESFTGLNHPDSWKQVSHHGMEAVIGCFRLICDFFESIEVPIVGINMVSGNHDRVTDSRSGDAEGQVSSIMAELLAAKYGDVVRYEPIRLSYMLGDTCFIQGHGHNAWNRKSHGDIISNYACDLTAKYFVILQGHLHTAISNGSSHYAGGVINETRTTTHLVSPSLFTGNDFSERGGWSGNAGYFEIDTFSDRSPEYKRRSLLYTI